MEFTLVMFDFPVCRLRRRQLRVMRLTAAVVMVTSALTASAIAAPTTALVTENPGHFAESATRPGRTLDEQIRDALVEQGTVESLARDFNSSKLKMSATRPGNDTVVAVMRMSLEQGDLEQALETLRTQIAAVPTEATFLELTASLEEKLGQVENAQRRLQAALSLTTHIASRTNIRLRLALLAFDSGDSAEGIRLLDAATVEDPDCSARAGVAASLAGQPEAAVRFLKLAKEGRPELKLLEGNSALQAGQDAAAAEAFHVALRGMTDAQDRRYAYERIIAAARHAGALSALADAWLADAELPADKLLPLAAVLRELDRVPELLRRWRQGVANARLSDAMLSRRFVMEIVNASQEAGLHAQVEEVVRELLALKPGDERSLAVAVQVMLNHQKPAEADALIAERVAACADQPEALEQLARLARSLGRDEAAVAVAQALRARGGGNAITAMLLEATIRLRAGDTAAGWKLLHEAAVAAKGQPLALRAVATALEAAGLSAEAVPLLQASVEQAADDATLERLAAMLLQQRRLSDAVPILSRLHANGATAAVRAQAGQRLLDIAVRDGTIDSLIRSMHASLATGAATEADLTLLVDAYTRVKNPAAASELLKTNTILDRKSTLSRLAVLYLRIGDLRGASVTLRELVSADPDSAVTTLERLAAVELDRKEPAAAAAAVDEIARRLGKQSASFTAFMGGTYDRLNRPGQAALFYRRALAANPENADVWLLWATATAKAGHAQQAINRLLVLCDEAASDTVFSLAVDGLLNLKAPPAALRAARRQAMLRAATASGKTMLFQVIADLSEELEETKNLFRALEVNATLDREERPQLLRDLMEDASRNGLLDQASAYGQSMLALEDNFPPQLFLQLGEQLLIAGRVQQASRAFSRAGEIGSDEQVAPRAAALFEEYGYPIFALRALTPLAERKRNLFSIRQTLARLEELTASDRTFETYLNALELADREMAALPRERPAVDAIPAPRPDLTAVVNGAISAARTPAQKEKLLNTLEAPLRRELIATSENAVGSPELLRWLGEYRRAGIATRRLDAVDQLDDAIILQRPDLKFIASTGLTARIESGLFSSARRFAATHGGLAPLPAWLALDTSGSSGLSASITDINDAVARLPKLMSCGHVEEARKLLGSVPLAIPPKAVETVPTLIAAAVALGDEGLATRWAIQWASQIVDPPQSPVLSSALAPAAASAVPSRSPLTVSVQEVRTLFQSSWRILPGPARLEIASLALSLSDRSVGTPAAMSAATLALQLADASGFDMADRIEVALRFNSATTASTRPVAEEAATKVNELALRFEFLPMKDHPEFLPRAIALLPPASRLTFLRRLIEKSPVPFDEETNTALKRAAESLPPRQELVWSSWFSNSAHRSVLPALASASLRSAGSGPGGAGDIAERVAAAVALSADSPDEASQIGVTAIQDILAGAPMALQNPGEGSPVATSRAAERTRAASSPANLPASSPGGSARGLPANVNRITVLRYAANVLRADAREELVHALIADERSTELSSTRRAFAFAAHSVLLEAVGRRDDALGALRQAFNLDRENAEIRQALVDRFKEDGRWAELVETFRSPSPQLSRFLRDPLSDALTALFRGREVPLPAKSVGVSAVIPRRVIDFMTPRATSDFEKLAEALRVYIERLRSNSDGFSPIVEADAAGQRSADGTQTEGLFGDLGRWPGSVDDLLMALRCLPRGRFAADRVVDLLGQAASDPVVAEYLLEHLRSARESGAIDTNDRMLIERLARVPGVKLLPGLLDEIWTDLLFDPTGDPDVWRLSECLRVQGDPGASALQRWAAVRSQVSNPTRSVLASRNTHARPSLLTGHTPRKEEAASQEVFQAQIDSALATLAWRQLGQPTRSSLQNLLPQGPLDASNRGEMISIFERAIDHAANRWPGNTNWTRAYAALGANCRSNGDMDSAERLLQKAFDFGSIQGVGEHQLWVADLARSLGHLERAIAIERRLLEERCLPAIRISALLRKLDEDGNATDALQLAKLAFAYCKDPNVFRRVAADVNNNSVYPR